MNEFGDWQFVGDSFGFDHDRIQYVWNELTNSLAREQIIERVGPAQKTRIKAQIRHFQLRRAFVQSLGYPAHFATHEPFWKIGIEDYFLDWWYYYAGVRLGYFDSHDITDRWKPDLWGSEDD